MRNRTRRGERLVAKASEWCKKLLPGTEFFLYLVK